MKQFDKGFSHSYPEQHGLSEGIVENERVIIELSKFQDTQPCTNSDELLFPLRKIAGLDFYVLPDDSRDLSSFVRLLRSKENAEYSGRLLAAKLIRTNMVFDGIPDDTILPRYSVFSDKQQSSNDYGGIDMKFLPPYINLTETLSNAGELIRDDFLDIGKISSAIIDPFMYALNERV